MGVCSTKVLTLRDKITSIKPVHPVLYLFYYFFKLLVRVSRRIFYAEITVVNRERGRFDNPCIVVSNHPSTLLDPLNAAVEMKTEVYFLANAGLFKSSAGNWFFNTFYTIPIERQQDTNGKPLDNAASFEKSTQHLAKGGCLYIAPEGTSYVYRRLRKIKTGTARIALAAESRNDFQLGLTILPVGLNYTNPAKFRSRLLTILGEPVPVADYKKAWEKDEIDAVQQLTARIDQAISALVINTTDDIEEKLLSGLEVIVQNENPLELYESFKRSKNLLAKLQKCRSASPLAYEAFAAQVFLYFEKIKSLKISDDAIKNSRRDIKNALGLVFTLPIFLLGIFSHFLPVFTAKKIHDLLNKDIHWESTYRYVAGLLTYPLFLVLQVWLVSKAGIVWLTWVYVLALFPAGLVAEWWLQQWNLTAQRSRVCSLIKHHPEKGKELAAMRSSILKEIRQMLQPAAPKSAPLQP